MMRDGVVIVTGLPSGGTSMVAGILHRLGVSMGPDCEWQSGKRRYVRYEDREFIKRYVAGVWPGDNTQPRESAHVALTRFQGYIRWRREEGEFGPIGVKHSRAAMIASAVRYFPLDYHVIDVSRANRDREARDEFYSGGGDDRREWLRLVSDHRDRMVEKARECGRLLEVEFNAVRYMPVAMTHLIAGHAARLVQHRLEREQVRRRLLLHRGPRGGSVVIKPGESVCIVGNGPSALDADRGKEIDSHDCVIRFNFFPSPKKYERQVGKKLDIWCACGNRAVRDAIPDPLPARGVMTMGSQLQAEVNQYRWLQESLIDRCEVGCVPNVARRVLEQAAHKELVRMGGTEPGGPARVSGGLVTAFWAARLAGRVRLVGFDGMEDGQHRYAFDRPDIPPARDGWHHEGLERAAYEVVAYHPAVEIMP